ncbi:SusC/RagA family TonB-linked outer membrane protein [Epilithonimonas sp.]|uniref:SusC/RagA family TonB-linked outer membrane protein n=1 Tax=Epilithonimonas sp. TaxID=2894511 RepID=UPI002FDD6D6A
MKNSYYTIGGIFFGLMLTTVSTNLKAQTRNISGTVTTSGKPLAGVIISQEGSQQVTTTSANGTYTLQVTAENPILWFRHPDYSEEKFTLTNQTVVNISLEQKVKGIEEVILNAGYYKVKDKERTGSIAKVSAKDIENQPVTNVLSAAQGRMAGVNIIQAGGTAGGGFDVQIRGRNSLRTILNSPVNGNQPLYVVDGIPWSANLTSSYSVGILPMSSINPLNSISPDDIESIEVLKDADATAIYGSRGGNGVILITTKKGSTGAVRLTVDTNYGISKVANQMKLMNTEQYLKMRRDAYTNYNVTIPANAYDINGVWDSNRYTDWQKTLIGNNAESSSVQLSVSGGSERNQFSISASHSSQSTVFPGDYKYKTNILNSNYNYITQNRRFSLAFSNILSSLSNNVISNDLTNRSLNLAPNAPALFDQSGNLNWQNNTFTNPLALLNGRYENKVLQINQNIKASYEVWKDLKFLLNGGINIQSLEEYSLAPNTMYNPAFASGASPARSSSSRGTSNLMSYIIEPQISWFKDLGASKLDFLLGYTFQINNSKSSAITASGFASNALLYNLAAASLITPRDFNDFDYKYTAVFGRVNYRLMNRYIINLTARRDGSSRFGPNNRFSNFGAIGAAWLFSEESLLKNSKWLSLGKLRGSFGRTGSDLIGDFQFTNSYSVATNSYNDVPALYPSRLFNPDFTWEKTDKLEAALELSLFRNLFNITTAYYRNRSSNQLVGIPLASTTGFSNVQANLNATVQNSGWEIEASTNLLKSTNWKWNVSFNISYPMSKLLSFPGLEGSTYANTYVIGQPTSIVKVYQYEGIDPVTGQYIFKDFNQDGKISSPEDQLAIRNVGTKYFGGFQNQIAYKNFSLSFLLQFVKQNSWNYYRTMTTPGNMNNQPEEFTNVWTSTNQNGIIMPYSPGTITTTNTLTSNFKNSTAAISDGSFIRLKNVQINYKLPYVNKVVSEARIYIQGQNLLTWTKFIGLDPEYTVNGYLPPLKTISMGFQLTF